MIEAGVEAAEFEELSETVAPLDPALLVSVTVPVDIAPPGTVEGDRDSLERVCAWTATGRHAARHIRPIKRPNSFTHEPTLDPVRSFNKSDTHPETTEA